MVTIRRGDVVLCDLNPVIGDEAEMGMVGNRTVYDLFSVEGKKALVTGGSAGLGRAMAEVLKTIWRVGQSKW